MKQRALRRTLRSAAVLMAMLAMIDPVWTRILPGSRQVVAIDLTSGGAATAVGALKSALAGREVVERAPADRGLPCAPDETCVMLADGSMDSAPAADLIAPISLIQIRADQGPNVAVTSATASLAHVTAAAAMRVQLRRTGETPATEIRVHDGAALVGAARHDWTAQERAAVVDVAWWPSYPAAGAVRVEAVPFAGEHVTFDNAVDVGPRRTSGGQDRIVIFDARPSWASTFLRRALEDDPRFSVEYHARVMPQPSVSLDALSDVTFESSPVLIVGGPDALTAGEVSRIDRFVRVRGGTAILLPERIITGPASRLVPGTWTEHLSAAPEAVGPLRAAEILRATGLPMVSTVVGRSGGSPSIVVVPSGEGRMVISGAMDAWRYRNVEAGAFDRFWRSLVAESATASAALALVPDTWLGAPGDRIPFTMRYRTLQAHAALEARVFVTCGDRFGESVRVWPGGALHEFRGEIPIGADAPCRVNATLGNSATSVSIAVRHHPARGVDATLARLERASRERGGVVVNAGNESAIARALDDSTESSRVVSVYPMRASWWIIPFAGLLSLEWFLRRRAGLR